MARKRCSASRFAAALFAAALAGAAPSVGTAGDDATCPRDVLVASSMQRQAIDQLESAGEDEAVRCRIWRRHVETMRRIATVYGRCLSGPERKQRLAEVQNAENEFGGLVRSRCRGL